MTGHPSPLPGGPLYRYGWNDDLATALQLSLDSNPVPDARPARIISQGRGVWRVVVDLGDSAETDGVEFWAKPIGRIGRDEDWPVTGDWVVATVVGDRAVIHSVLPRRTAILRKVAGVATVAQVIAANVDVVFISSSLDGDLNPRRLERYLALVWESGAEPVLVLTKADSCDEAFLARALDEVKAIAFGAAVHVVSSATGQGIEEIRRYFEPNRSVAILGSSGIGKSTLVNALAGGEVMATAELRSDGRGRHTTTHRELVLLPTGGLILDTPGMRELQLWSSDDGVAATFPDVEQVVAACRFSDCRHGSEPGCAVVKGLADGSLDRLRYDSWTKLQTELAHLAQRQDARLAAEERRKWKRITKEAKSRTRP